MRADLAAAVGAPCAYCRQGMFPPTRDHVYPRSKGGTLEGQNKALACERCNTDKGSLKIGQWLYRLRKAGDPRAEIVARFVNSSFEARRFTLAGF